MKMLQVKDFFSTSIIYHDFLQTFQLSLSSSFVVISYCFYLFIRFQSLSRCLNFTVIFLTVPSEDVRYIFGNKESL